MEDKKKVFISLGSNLGDRIETILKAYQEIEQRIGPIEAKSSFYKTPPWGFESNEYFINTMIQLSTNMEVLELLDQLKQIEKGFGRKEKISTQGYQNRPIDLDIIDYNGEHVSDQIVTVPHPRMHLRNFVIFPLKEIAPYWIHPIFKKDVETLKKSLINDSSIGWIEQLID